MDLFSLDGRTAVVTGASGAIGGAIALGFARAGADLALVYHRNAAAAERIESEASGLGVTARTYRVDVTDADGVRANADRIVADFGAIHILLNSAGGNLKSAITGPDTGFFDLAPQAILDTMTLNFMGGAVLPCLFYGARMVANEMGGAIINGGQQLHAVAGLPRGQALHTPDSGQRHRPRLLSQRANARKPVRR